MDFLTKERTNFIFPLCLSQALHELDNGLQFSSNCFSLLALLIKILSPSRNMPTELYQLQTTP